MAGWNQAILTGNLGADPELRHTQGGQAVANFRMATNESWTDKDGKKQEDVEWHRIVVWGKQAELCAEFLAKGRQVQVIGKIRTREWTDKEGKKQYTTEIVATNVVFLGSGDGSNRREPPPPEEPPPGQRGREESRSSSPSSNGGQRSNGGRPQQGEDIPF